MKQAVQPFSSLRSRVAPFLGALLLALVQVACRGPELRVSAELDLGVPMHLAVQLPEGPHRLQREKLLRDHLADALKDHYILIETEDRKDRDPVLQIAVNEISRTRAVAKIIQENAIQGAERGSSLGDDIEFQSHDPESLIGGIFLLVLTKATATTVGAVAGTIGGVSDGLAQSAQQDLRLGYHPKHLICTISYASDGSAPLQVVGTTDAWAVLKEMQPMSSQDAHDVQKLHREEARALAKVIQRLLRKLENKPTSAP